MQHVHVYFNAAAKNQALELRELISDRFPELKLGKVHDDPVGPHPLGSYLVLLPDDKEAEVKVFLEDNSQGLSILFHPVSGDDAHDHSDENVSWIGQPLELDHSAFHP